MNVVCPSLDNNTIDECTVHTYLSNNGVVMIEVVIDTRMLFSDGSPAVFMFLFRFYTGALSGSLPGLCARSLG